MTVNKMDIFSNCLVILFQCFCCSDSLMYLSQKWHFFLVVLVERDTENKGFSIELISPRCYLLVIESCAICCLEESWGSLSKMDRNIHIILFLYLTQLFCLVYAQKCKLWYKYLFSAFMHISEYHWLSAFTYCGNEFFKQICV